GITLAWSAFRGHWRTRHAVACPPCRPLGRTRGRGDATGHGGRNAAGPVPPAARHSAALLRHGRGDRPPEPPLARRATRALVARRPPALWPLLRRADYNTARGDAQDDRRGNPPREYDRRRAARAAGTAAAVRPGGAGRIVCQR